MRSYISLSFLLLLCVSCYEKQEGCLDITAANYDFEADEPCDNCCTYPVMNVSVLHSWGDTTLMEDSIYVNTFGQQLQILNTEFILSNFSFLKAGESFTVLDEVEVQDINGNEFTIPKNFATVNDDVFSFRIGQFASPQIYDGLKMTLGVDGRFTNEGIVTNQTLFDETTLTYTNFKMEYIRNGDTLFYELSGPELTKPIEINVAIEIPTAVNFTIPLEINYKDFLNEVDLDLLGEALTDQQILNDFTFSLR